jgi:hypothetical protein
MAIPGTVPTDELFAGTGDAVEWRSSAHLWRYALQRNVFHGWYAESGVSLGAEEQKTAIGN